MDWFLGRAWEVHLPIFTFGIFIPHPNRPVSKSKVLEVVGLRHSSTYPLSFLTIFIGCAIVRKSEAFVVECVQGQNSLFANNLVTSIDNSNDQYNIHNRIFHIHLP